MLGILVHGNNHFILKGPLPNEAQARSMVQHWSIIQIALGNSERDGREKLMHFEQWEMRTKEFRENLEWAVEAPGDGETSAAVRQLLDELAARGIQIKDYTRPG